MNKGIYLKTADIYLRFPEIMEEECNDLAEFLEDEHIVYEGATDIVYNLQQENQRLKEIEKEHQKINGELRVENKELKKQLEDTNEELELVRCDLHNRTSERDSYYRNIEILENQQKEFIEFLEEQIKERKIQILGYHPTTQLLIEQIIETEKMVLSKYKEIIGSDSNEI